MGLYENGFGLMNLGLFNPFCLRFLMRIVFIYVVCCYSCESGSNSGFRMDFLGFKFGFLRFFWVSAILIAIKMNIDRDQDEHFPDRDEH